MRIKLACVLPLLLSVGCQASATDDLDEVQSALVGENEIALESKHGRKHKRDRAQARYDGFVGRYEVAKLPSEEAPAPVLLARTAGFPTAAGGPVPAFIYYPAGCKPEFEGKIEGKLKPKQDNKSWVGCEGKKRKKGQDADFTDAFPMVAILQGGNVVNTQYSEFAAEVASYGFVVVVPHLEQSFGPGAPPMALTSQFVPTWVADDLTIRDATPGSPLYGIVDTENLAVVGHSFGAAAALAAVNGTCQPPFCFPPAQYTRPESLKVAVAQGFQNCDPTQGQCFYPDTSAAATMIVNGSLDDPGEPTDTAYAGLSNPRALVVLDDTNHFGLTNDDLSSPFGPNPEPNGLPQDVTIPRTARWTAAWLRTYFQGDRSATKLVEKTERVEGATVQSDM